jgi:hypothetical protein
MKTDKTRLLLLLLLTLVVGCAMYEPAAVPAGAENAATQAVVRVESPLRWNEAQTLHRGIKYLKLEFDEPRMIQAYLVRIDLKTRGLKFTGTGRADRWGEPMLDVTNRVTIIRTRRQTTVNFMRQLRKPVAEGGRGLDAVLAFNSAAWEPWEKPFTHRYAYPYGLQISDGVIINKGGGGGTFAVRKDGSAFIARRIPQEQHGELSLAHTGFGVIMENGKSLAKPGDTALAPRMAYGLSANKRWLYVLAVDGRQEGWSLGANMHDLVAILRAAGASDALNMDGGGSTSLVHWDESRGRPVMLNRHDERGSARSVAMNIGIYFE